MSAIKKRERVSILADVEGKLLAQIRSYKPNMLARLQSVLTENPEALRMIFENIHSVAKDAKEAEQGKQGAGSDPAPDNYVLMNIQKGPGLGESLSPEEGRKLIADISQDVPLDAWVNSKVMGVGALAKQLGIVPQTIANWRNQHKILALRKGVRNFVYPIRQFNRNAPVEGIAEVWKHFEDDETAWEWLVTKNYGMDGALPIDRLLEGRADEVVSAAEGSVDF
ncbi:antitoxin Xre/MbcA/ParS-like domain-containing protein [Novosphingobium rosa]|uniref:antitoxin Xre/MbcA/ParS-like domain-containing protein n=1 Tax=Novosphingobium rosa TaxID=76978 RepID=UPI00083273CB|nr:hypothetical protein [Novosphingobium rosa]